jgi:two-component system sensor histidine kinase BaeS
MLAAAAAALLMVRVLVKRLRALETVAARVAEGDLSARIETSGADEIGGLEERFNRMTERLAAARDAVDETDRQRRRLLADITHELATPLTSIRGYVETLLDPGVPVTVEERTGYLRDVLEEAQRLDLLSSDLLDLARLEAGAQPLKRVRLDWSALCQNAARRFEPRFREAGLRLEWIGTPPEAWVMADGRRMEQVIENLLVNALRYVPRGGTVRLGLDRVASAGGDRFRLAVSDDGPGIADQDLPHVFERFYRASHAREGTGSGLGLAIVREIVVRHGGEARAEHHAPRGARFVVELPVEA